MLKYLALLLIIFLLSGCIQEEFVCTEQNVQAELSKLISKAQGFSSAKVARVLDGDTFELIDGQKVRLIGINAPEEKEKYAQEAKEYLEELILGKEIFLEQDKESKDRYGRLLRYVYTNESFVNAELISAGYAISYRREPNTKHQALLSCIQNLTATQQIGLWAAPAVQYKIKIFAHYNAEGNDRENLNDEYIIFTNLGKSINLEGWTVSDESNHVYTFPAIKFYTGTNITLYTGSGKDTGEKLYWNSRRPIWNNAGDTVFLRDKEGNLVVSFTY